MSEDLEVTLEAVLLAADSDAITVRLKMLGKVETVSLPNTMANTNFWFWARGVKLGQLLERACEEIVARNNREARDAERSLKRLGGQPY